MPTPICPSADQRAPLSILLVERDPDVTDLLSTLLESEGHQVFSARNAAEGLALAKQHTPDVIFSGIELPDCKGFLFAAQIRSTPKISECVIVALTGHGKESDVELGKGVGFNHFLVKPASIDAILATLATVPAKARGALESAPDPMRR